MVLTTKKVSVLVVVAGLMACFLVLKTPAAYGQLANAAPQTANADTSVSAPKPEYVAAGTEEALKLLRLMDADKSGKVSRAEFMAFMAAEFERLDINHDGELDLKELKNSQLVTAHRGGSRR